MTYPPPVPNQPPMRPHQVPPTGPPSHGGRHGPPPMPPQQRPYPPLHPEAEEFYRRENLIARRQWNAYLWKAISVGVIVAMLFGFFLWNAIFR